MRHRLLSVIKAALLLCFACTRTSPVETALDTTRAANSTPAAELGPPPASPGPAERPEHALAKVPVAATDPQWGSVDAPVTIVEFSDFQCPFCSRVNATLSALKDKYGPQQLRLVFKHTPLPFHAFARPAAETAAAVFELGGSGAFFAFHDRAFASQLQLSTENLESWAVGAGIQVTALRAELASGRPRDKVDEDLRVGGELGVNGTPAFRINGVTLAGAQPLESFVAIVDEQLAAAARLRSAGTPARAIYATLTDQNLVVPPPPSPPRAEADDDTSVWKLPIASDDPQRGPRDALVTVVVFSDFQCPFCKRVEGTLDELRRIYDKDLRIVWKDNPLPFHLRAKPAAQVARAVYQARGNDAFWKMHDALFAGPSRLEDADLEALAKEQGLSAGAVHAALKSEKLGARIDESVEQATDFQARGTPHFFINGRRLAGAQPLSKFQELIDAELVRSRALSASGTPRIKLYAELTKDGKTPPPPETKTVPVPPGSVSRGDAKAPVVIQVFSDFQCPFCKRVEPTLSQLEQEFKGSIRIVWRHYPLPFHQQAQLAAEAAEEVLAQKGPDAFWKYHDLLFEAQGEPGLERTTLDVLADQLGLDMSRFGAALDGRTHQAKVDADAEAAQRADINGTPGFVINDYYLSGAQPVAAFRRLIKLALKDRGRH
jgi:protein-disulfide isomerase